MIADIKLCTASELADQIRYLSPTPVSDIAKLLQSGQCRLSQGVIRSLADLGALKTEFGAIGPLTPPAMQGEKKFRVREILSLLHANPGIDVDLHTKIDAFLQDDEGNIDYNVTVMRLNNDLIIKDGNKRSIAFYERRRGSTEQIDYPVFLVEYTIGAFSQIRHP